MCGKGSAVTEEKQRTEKPQPSEHDLAVLEAAYLFVAQMRGRADGALDLGTSPFWHGWALCEAFLAGVHWGQKLRRGMQHD